MTDGEPLSFGGNSWPGQMSPGAAALSDCETREFYIFPLSPAQEGVWLTRRYLGEGALFNLSHVLTLHLPNGTDLLSVGLHELVNRHEALRTYFPVVNGRLVQVIANEYEFAFVEADLMGLPPKRAQKELRRLADEDAKLPFDTSQFPLFRFKLVRLTTDDYALIMTIHYMIADPWSLSVLSRELPAVMSATRNGHTSQLPSLPVQYGDYARWQHERTTALPFNEHLVYWTNKLAGARPVSFPHDRSTHVSSSTDTAVSHFSLRPSLVSSIRTLSHRSHATLFMTLLGAFYTLLYRHTAETDLVLGSYLAGRNRAEVEQLVGLFSNSLALRVDISGNLRFIDVLQKVKDCVLDAYVHQELPLTRVIEELQLTRDAGRHPIFDIVFQMLNWPAADRDFAIAADPPRLIEKGSAGAVFDMSWSMWESGNVLRGRVEYNTALFRSTTIQTLVERYKVLLGSIAADPEQRVSEIPVLTSTEQRRAIVASNATRRNHLCGKPGLVQLFEHQVNSNPYATALIDGPSKVSFLELDWRVNRLARYLRRRGAGQESVVAICLEQRIQIATTVLAVIKAGGAFLLIDRIASDAYSKQVLNDARPPLLVTDSSHTPGGGYAGTVVMVDVEEHEIERESEEALNIDTPPESLACIVYTSGSTGRPKGVAIEHRQILNRLAWMWSSYPFKPGDKCCQRVPPNFIDYIWELLGPLLAGIPVVQISTEAMADARTLVDVLSLNGVTRIWVFPSFLKTLFDSLPDIRAKLPMLDFWVSTGEPLNPELVERFAAQCPDAQLFNLYGTSEVWDATWSTAYHPGARSKHAAIGSPIHNVRCYIVDRYLNVVPPGATGELCVAGAGVSRGYWKDPSRTAERFVPDPFSRTPGSRMYRTGDLARWSHEGGIEFLGRMDRQVKVRGVRVELGEIESAINRHPDVKRAVVTSEHKPGAVRLHAYVVTRAGAAPRPSELDEFLKFSAPTHIVPASYTFLDELPVLPSGKVDSAALPGEASHDGARADVPSPDLRTKSQDEIAAVWRGVLNISKVGLDDSFFNLGGHSLLMMSVYRGLPEGTRQKLTIVDLFKYPTVRALAAYLDAADVRARSGGAQ